MAIDNMVRVNIRISRDMHQYFKNKSIRTGISMSALMYLELEKSLESRLLKETQKAAESGGAWRG